MAVERVAVMGVERRVAVDMEGKVARLAAAMARAVERVAMRVVRAIVVVRVASTGVGEMEAIRVVVAGV